MDRNICELVQLSVRETKHMKIEGERGKAARNQGIKCLKCTLSHANDCQK